jgi:hypothetical protein
MAFSFLVRVRYEDQPTLDQPADAGGGKGRARGARQGADARANRAPELASGPRFGSGRRFERRDL